MHLETLLYDKSEGIATITLNRPDRLNAINYRMNQELADVWGDIKQDQEIVVAVVTAAGDRSFCTGFDMAASADGEGHPAQSKTGAHFELLFTALQNNCWKPVITAVNGMVTGGGLHFIADSDLVIAAEHATFFDTHVRVGRPSVTEPIALARRMPLETIMRMVMLGGAERNQRPTGVRGRHGRRRGPQRAPHGAGQGHGQGYHGELPGHAHGIEKGDLGGTQLRPPRCRGAWVGDPERPWGPS